MSLCQFLRFGRLVKGKGTSQLALDVIQMVPWPYDTHIWFGVYQELVNLLLDMSDQVTPGCSQFGRQDMIWNFSRLRKCVALGPGLQGTISGSLEFQLIWEMVGYLTLHDSHPLTQKSEGNMGQNFSYGWGKITKELIRPTLHYLHPLTQYLKIWRYFG